MVHISFRFMVMIAQSRTYYNEKHRRFSSC